jgi:hypothetical protein
LAQNRPGMFLEDQAGGRKQHAFAASLKESNPQPGFEVADLLRDTRLRDAKAIGGAAEIACLGYGQKIPQMTDLNGIVHTAKQVEGNWRKTQFAGLYPGHLHG